MFNEINRVLKEVVNQSGLTALTSETTLAALLLFVGFYEGHEKDLATIGIIGTGAELEKIISTGEWSFKNTYAWKKEIEKCKVVSFKGSPYVLLQEPRAFIKEPYMFDSNTLKNASFRSLAMSKNNKKYWVKWCLKESVLKSVELFNLETLDVLTEEQQKYKQILIDSGVDSFECQCIDDVCDWDSPATVELLL
jgi:hypothetical protein